MKKILKHQKKKWTILFFIVIFFSLVIFTFLQGCARWPNGNGNGNGDGEKKMILEVYFDDSLNTENGKYYIAMRPDPEVSFAPGNEVNSWQEGDYYIIWDSFECSLYRVIEGQEENNFIGFLNPNTEEDNYRITLELSDIGDPEDIYCNVVTTDNLNNTLDYLDEVFIIDTGNLFTQIVYDAEDDTDDSSYDITEVRVTVYTP